jgi:hypothetical protein
MTDLHRRKMTWALVLWSGYIATWTALTGPGPTIVILWWLVGVVVFGLLWFAKPLFRRGRRREGRLVRPGSTHWRVPLHAWEDEGGATLTRDGR